MSASSATGLIKRTQMAKIPELPDDIWGIILSKLTVDDTIRMMGVCRHWRDCGYKETSTSIIWQLNYGALSDSREGSAPLGEKEDKEAQTGKARVAHIYDHHQSRLAFIRRRKSSLKLISIGNIRANGLIVMGFLEAIRECDELLALDIQARGMFTDVLSIDPNPCVKLPWQLAYLRTNLPDEFISAVDCTDYLCYMDVDMQLLRYGLGPRKLHQLTALTLRQVRLFELPDCKWYPLSAIQFLDLHYTKSHSDRNEELIQDLIDNVLPKFDKLKELSLHLPHLDSSVLLLEEEANLNISLSCLTCNVGVDKFLYWPQLENLHIATLSGDFAMYSGLRGKRMSLKRLVVDNYDGWATIDPESLVGRYASLQHLELGCEEIDIPEARDPQALVPLDGQSCTLILRSKFELECEHEGRLLSLGFTLVPSNNLPASPKFPNTLMMQYGASEHVLPSQPMPFQSA